MASRNELKQALGTSKNLNSRSVENKAIRAFCVGGDDCLDAMEKVNRLAERLRDRSLPGSEAANEALEALREVRDLMVEFLNEMPIEHLISCSGREQQK